MKKNQKLWAPLCTAQTTSLEKIIVLDFWQSHSWLRRICELVSLKRALHNDITAEEIKALWQRVIAFFRGHIAMQRMLTVDPAIFELGIPVPSGFTWMQPTTIRSWTVESSTTREIWFCESRCLLTRLQHFQRVSWRGRGTEPRRPLSWFRKGLAWRFSWMRTRHLRLLKPQTPFTAWPVPPRSAPQYLTETTCFVTVFDICGATGDWSMDSFIEMEIAKTAVQYKETYRFWE